ncbi:iron-containing redox enzyme family protein [Streptomyces sp. SID6673]|nr:iron-containing redox enzyme family protein [Streptomyces sp. SID11726]NEB23972.1 iron-containing redox enzyme family protein [Streptomyces sp. SID6673]
MPLPVPRGPLSGAVVSTLTAGHAGLDQLRDRMASGLPTGNDFLLDEDIAITLTMLYELHLRGIAGVSDDWEWNADLLAARAVLEARFLEAIDDMVGTVQPPADVEGALWEIGNADDGPPVSSFMARTADGDHFRELLVHRSLHQLREADVHTMAIPRLHGAAKAGLVEVQMDEYGGGSVDRMHATLYARMMRALGLNSDYAHYVDVIPASTLAGVNALSMFGVHRSLRYELIGHLCTVEMTSALPSRKYSRGLARLGFGPDTRLFFDEHVEADSVHEQLIVREVAGRLATGDPAAGAALIRGARACAAFDALAAEHVWRCWESADTSLLRPLEGVTS